ncbi:MAG: UDP-N-acetylglucosamine 2-epimerase (non-hydrolyzing) [Flavobacteriales bacterium]|jgi:UDP-GlcNAc3NAcA epimerase|nr:UDP-N-acetylglucosamine 2-epimerase (non-hydrolyzing) [Flavobacteriales bacterium]
MRRLLSIVGARPQFVKVAAVDRAVNLHGGILHEVLHTGQHYDDAMSRVFFHELSIPAAKTHLGIGSGQHGSQTARMIEGIEQALIAQRPDAVLLYGDTNSTLAGAIAAVKLGLPIAHVEAGLRSFTKSMPEEINRVLCDHCSAWLFCPTEAAVANLRAEGIIDRAAAHASSDHPCVSLTGDVMLDSSMHFAGLAKERSHVIRESGLKENGFFLATIHRDFNADNPERLNALLNALSACAESHGLPVVLPLHPRTRQRLGIHGATSIDPERIRLIEPVGYLDMIALEMNASLVLTDSGGVQKEAFFYGKPCVVLRRETEWTELIDHGQAMLTDADQDQILHAVGRFLRNGAPACPPLYGDGHAADRIVALLA